MEENQLDSGDTINELRPGKQTNTSKTGRSNQLENSDALPQTPTNHNWNQLLPATQTMVVPPLTRMEGLVPVEGGDRESKVQRLAVLEKEATRIRKLLGLEVVKTSQGTMTTADSGAENAKLELLRTTLSDARREVSCQTDAAEVSTINSKINQLHNLYQLLGLPLDFLS